MDFNINTLLAAGSQRSDYTLEQQSHQQPLLLQQQQQHLAVHLAAGIASTRPPGAFKGSDPLLCAPAAHSSTALPLPAIVPTIGESPLEDPLTSGVRFPETNELLCLAVDPLKKPYQPGRSHTSIAPLTTDPQQPTDSAATSSVVPQADGAAVTDQKLAEDDGSPVEATGQMEESGELPAAAETRRASSCRGGLRRSKRVAAVVAVRQSSRTRTVPKRLIDTYTMESGDTAGGFGEDSGGESGEEADVMDKAMIQTKLAKKMKDLDKCVARTKGLSTADKKRVRNRHASCVSRLKKKLYVHNMQTELEEAKKTIEELRSSMQRQQMEVRLLQRENQNLRERLHGQPPSAYYPTFCFD